MRVRAYQVTEARTRTAVTDCSADTAAVQLGGAAGELITMAEG